MLHGKPRVVGEKLSGFVGRQRAGHQETLNFVAVHIPQVIRLFLRLDPLGHDPNVETVGQTDDGPGYGGGLLVRCDRAGEGLVDFELADGKLAQVGEARVAGPEVVEGDLHPLGVKGFERLNCILAVLQQGAFRYLQLQVGRIQAGFIQNLEYPGHKGAGMQLGGRKIDRIFDWPVD